MLEKAGFTNIQAYDSNQSPGQGIHEMGTARMGRDAKTSVLNGDNQVWSAKNVYVTDGACMASPLVKTHPLPIWRLQRALPHMP